MKYVVIFSVILSLASPLSFAKEKSSHREKEKRHYSGNSSMVKLKRQVNQNSEKITNLSEQVQQISNNTGGDTTTGGMQQQVQTNTSNINNLNTTVNNLSTQVQSNNTGISNLNSQLQTATTTLNAQSVQIQNNSNSNTNQDSQLLTNITNIFNNSNRITNLENASNGGGTTVPTIDFLSYIPAAGTKEFQEISNSSSSCTIVRHYITRTDNAVDSDIHVKESVTNGLYDCATYDFDYKLTAMSLSLVTYKDHSISAAINFDSPGEVLKVSMEEGRSFGFASTNINNAAQVAMQKSTILGVESVNVPAGAYTNCLKIETKLKSNFMMPNFERVSWHCPGVGEVKRVYYDADADNYISRLLVSVQ